MAPFKVAILFENVQLTDVTCIDLLASCSRAYLEKGSVIYHHFLPYSKEMELFYVSSSLDPPETSADARWLPTHTYETAPRDVDLMLIGGPSPTSRPPASLKYMQEVCADQHEKVVMTTCTGGLWLADSGCVKGAQLTTNRGFIPMAAKLHPENEWKDQRWVVSKQGHITFWTAGGAGAGYDMMGTYITEHFDPRLSSSILDALDFEPTARGQFYSKPDSGWLSSILETWMSQTSQKA